MRVLVRHGHFAFFSAKAGDIARFMNIYGIELVRVEDYYTFPALEDAEDYALAVKPYLNLPAVKTFEGKPWEVMKENGFVYSIATELLIPKLAVVSVIELPQAEFYYLAINSLVQPGSRLTNGQQILSYDGEFLQDSFKLRIASIDFE